MSKEAVFTMKLEPELRADFMAEVAGEDRPASQVMRELMRGYIEQRRQARHDRTSRDRPVTTRQQQASYRSEQDAHPGQQPPGARFTVRFLAAP